MHKESILILNHQTADESGAETLPFAIPGVGVLQPFPEAERRCPSEAVQPGGAEPADAAGGPGDQRERADVD